MKKNHILAFTIILFIGFSCSITNRRYMPGVAISWKKTNIGKKSKKKANKNTKFIEQKTSVAKLDYANESEPSALEKKQHFNTRAQKSKSTFFQRKTIEKNHTKIKRGEINSFKSNIKKDHLIFVPSPQDSIKKQEKKPIHPMDKKGRNKIFSSMFWALFSPLLGFITMVGFWSESAFIFGPIFGILLSLGFWVWGMSLFKKAENDEKITEFKDFSSKRELLIVLSLAFIILFGIGGSFLYFSRLF